MPRSIGPMQTGNSRSAPDGLTRVSDMCSGISSWFTNLLKPNEDSPAFLRFKERLEGSAALDVHFQPAPANSLLLLGYLALRVPDKDLAHRFYADGLDFRTSPKQENGEIRVNGGFCQFRLQWENPETGESVLKAQRWPGTLRLWVKDSGENVELLRRAGFPISEILPGSSSGLRLEVRDPWKTNIMQVEEAPVRLQKRFEKFKADPFRNQADQSVCSICLSEFTEQDTCQSLQCNHTFHAECIREWLNTSADCPLCKVVVERGIAFKSNALAIINATYKLPTKGMASSLESFYCEVLKAAAEVVPAPSRGCQQCQVHFSPDPLIHQTLIFEEDTYAVECEDPGTICIYVRTPECFHSAFEKCNAYGLICRLPSWSEALACCEFEISGCVDPASQQKIIPLHHVIRSPAHQECPFRPGDTALPVSVRSAVF